ncbi:MAG TPA: LamG domain-containing protein [Candidatus Pacearchaeota archaeon]|nr:LamG domain-containing protein [Candidatus Pacearchaeota archaeon]
MNKSFTLIEILVVIVVIGILSAFILVGTSSITNSANIAKSKAFSDSLRNSLLNNLVSEWKLDENTGNTTIDSWKGGNTGTLNGATHLPVWKTGSDCIDDSCLSFDGTEDYVNCGTNSNLNIIQDITIGAWIRTNTLSGEKTILRNGYALNSFNFRQYNGRICFGYTHSSGTWVNLYTTNQVLTTNFNYVLVTVSGTSLKFYFNGINIPGDTTGANINNRDLRDTYTSIGHDTGGTPDQFFNGIIDNIQIYDATISSFQVEQNYFLGLNKLYKNNGIAKIEYIQRLAELKFDLANNE